MAHLHDRAFDVTRDLGYGPELVSRFADDLTDAEILALPTEAQAWVCEALCLGIEGGEVYDATERETAQRRAA
jgi:hypothetical protein